MRFRGNSFWRRIRHMALAAHHLRLYSITRKTFGSCLSIRSGLPIAGSCSSITESYPDINP